jgi:hypothetical protein
MVELEPARVGQHRLQVGRVVRASGPKADQMLVAAAVGDLHDAQAVAAELKSHRLGVDRDGPVGEDSFGKVLFVEMDGHAVPEIGCRGARLNGRPRRR